MQQIIFKREFSVSLDAVKTKNVYHIKEKMQFIKNIVNKKTEKK